MSTKIVLSPDLEERLNFLALEIGGTTDAFLYEIIERGMEDVEEYYLSIEVLECIRAGRERIYLSAKVRRELVLDG